MRTKIQFTAIAFIYCFCATGVPGAKCGFTDRYYSSKAEKLSSSFNTGNTSLNSSAFTENKGQVFGFDGLPHSEVKFVFKQGNTQIFLLEKGIAYQFTYIHFPEGYTELMSKRDGVQDIKKLQLLQEQIRTETFRMDMTLVGANANTEITSEGKSEDYINFYNRDVLDVHHYTKITYHEIYAGIDWVIYAKNGQVKYDFVVKPGADPSLIKMQFEHQEDLSLNKDGSFTLSNTLGSITENKPLSYQGKENIHTNFILKDNKISFALASYDHNQSLIIDPALVWATYYGDTGFDNGYSCVTDALGNIYLAGTTQSSAAIASGGYQDTIGGGSDAFLVKFNSSGVRQWATYYGGTGNEIGYSCSTDASGNIYLAGSTNSSSGIASGGHQNTSGGGPLGDAYLVKFDGGGAIQWATYYGGTADDAGGSCATDASGNIYLAGYTGSSSNIASGGHQNTLGGLGDAFVVKFNGSGVRQWATYYGNTGTDRGLSCATDASGNVYLAGYSNSSAGIASGGHQNIIGGSNDAFLVKFNGNGVRQWATFYGGSGSDLGYSCATDNSGNIYLAGSTESSSGIASGGHSNLFAGGFTDAFLVKFNSSGVRQWATYYGGAGSDDGSSCFTDASGNIYLTGDTGSSSAIATSGYQTVFGGVVDGFLVGFNSSGIRQWGTYYGGPAFDYALSGTIDNSGSIFLAGYTNSSSGIASGGHQNIKGSANDAFLVKFCSGISPSQPLAINGNTFFCVGLTQTYSVSNDPNASTYTWILPAAWTGSSTTNIISVVPGTTGVLGVSASNTCGAAAFQTLNVVVNQSPTITVNSGIICSGESFTIVPSGAANYTISGGTTTVSPLANSAYSVIGTSSAGCVSSNTAVASVIVDKCTSVNETESQRNIIEVFPNPNAGSFEIRSASPVRISLYNEIGQRVWENDSELPNKSVIIQGLAKGIYLAHMVSEFGSSVRTIVVLSN